MLCNAICVSVCVCMCMCWISNPLLTNQHYFISATMSLLMQLDSQ